MSLEVLELCLTRAIPWGLYILLEGKPTRAQRTLGSPTDPNREPITANLGDLNPFWVGTRLLCIETLVECLH